MQQTQLVRTTVRLPQQLKKDADHAAIELDISFQDLVEKALARFLQEKNRIKAKEIVFKSKPLGKDLDNLTREDIYAD
jgi:hypothetical protein